jgi:Undecaprenyl-phosphate glucose phosphotransferase
MRGFSDVIEEKTVQRQPIQARAAVRLSSANGPVMRLSTYSHLIPVAPHPQLIPRLLETVLAAGCAFVAHRMVGVAHTPNDSVAIAFAVLLAWCWMPARQAARTLGRVAHVRSIVWLALGWVLCEIAAIGMVKWLHRDFKPSLDWVECWIALTAIGVVMVRLFALCSIKRQTRTHSVAIVGHGEHCSALACAVAAMNHSMYRVDAQFNVDVAPGLQASEGPSRQDIEAIAEQVRARGIDELWLALPLADEATLLLFLDVFRNDLLNIRFLPDVSRLTRFHSDAIGLDRTFAINLVASPLTAKALAVKATFDRIFAFFALILISPVLLGVALAVRLSSPGPVLFKQWRHGANGQPFEILKFRTMRVHEAREGEIAQATRGDPRITAVGAFLRRTSLDELPQFINVLRGEMSVVGPRPHAIEHDALYQNIVDGYIHRYRIKPGITGWAQINGFRGETDSIEKMRQRVEHDLHYLSNWSLGLDLRIVLATVTRGFVHRNAY